ncbi:MAG: hypothetical protein KGR26_05985 [Cyanobacteria bacterium REEB65]|nr:hypothetical protein [Cyanobacteria bacterium REEB65]
MKASLLTEDMIVAFKSKGGATTRCKPGAKSGPSSKEWKAMVRGEKPPIEIIVPPAPRTPVRIRVGFGAY